MEKQPCVYLLASSRNGTLYAGVTSNLIGRTWQHREHVAEGFSKRYEVIRLVWYELHPTMESAIQREKAYQEMEQGLESPLDRRRQSFMAGFVAGYHRAGTESQRPWIPAFAGMTT